MGRHLNQRACLSHYDDVHIGGNYTDEELDFLKAIDRHKREHHVRLMTVRDVFYVALCMGYRKTEEIAEAGA